MWRESNGAASSVKSSRQHGGGGSISESEMAAA